MLCPLRRVLRLIETKQQNRVEFCISYNFLNFFVCLYLQVRSGRQCPIQRSSHTTRNSHVLVNYTWKNTQIIDIGKFELTCVKFSCLRFYLGSFTRILKVIKWNSMARLLTCYRIWRNTIQLSGDLANQFDSLSKPDLANQFDSLSKPDLANQFLSILKCRPLLLLLSNLN